MNFVSKLLQGISFVPSIVQGVEGLFGAKGGDAKKNAALAIVSAAINAGDLIANKQIVDPAKFQAALGRVIDGVVECLNASAWAGKA